MYTYGNYTIKRNHDHYEAWLDGKFAFSGDTRSEIEADIDNEEE